MDADEDAAVVALTHDEGYRQGIVNAGAGGAGSYLRPSASICGSPTESCGLRADLG